MSLSKLPPAASIPSLPTQSQTGILDLLFEPSPPLHNLCLPILAPQPFPTYPALISAIKTRLTILSSSAQTSPQDKAQLEEILSSHPRLGAKKVHSAQSAAEQAQLQAQGSGNDEEAARVEAEELARLNEEYERTFPGLRYVVFVNGRGRGVIMEDMRRRIQGGDLVGEREAAIQAMCDIAVDRASKLA